MDLYTLVAAYSFCVGLVVGSYLNVVIHRLPRGESTVLPRSACPACGAQVRAYDNVPILSYLLLRGRCRDCQAPISWRYPAIEGATGLLFLLAFLRFGLDLDSLVAALFAAAMLALAVIDFEHFLLPDAITLPGILAGLIASRFVGFTTPLSSALGTLVGGGVLLLLIGVWYLIRREQGMGYGDVKMLAMIGAFLGLGGMLVSLFFASLAGAGVGVTLLASGRLSARSKLQFGTFLAAGALVALFAGEDLIASYRRLL